VPGHRLAGIAFVGVGASALILATSWGGSTYAWTSPTIIGLFVLAVVALLVFVRVEIRAVQPILPMRLFRSQVFAVCCALSFLVGFAMLGSITFVPTFLQRRWGVGDRLGDTHAAAGRRADVHGVAQRGAGQ
jgi:hypothetical protein